VNFSGLRPAAVFGIICPKVEIKKEATKGARAEPLLPRIFIARAVARADAREFRKFVPTRTTVRSLSMFDLSFATVEACFLPSSCIRRSFIFERERYAVSEDVKNPMQTSRRIKIIITGRLFI